MPTQNNGRPEADLKPVPNKPGADAEFERDLHHRTFQLLTPPERRSLRQYIDGSWQLDEKLLAGADKDTLLLARKYVRLKKRMELYIDDQKDYAQKRVSTVPIWIDQEQGLGDFAKRILAEIHHQSQGELGCFKSNLYFAMQYGRSVASIRQIISRLKRDGWLDVKLDVLEGKRYLKLNLDAFTVTPSVTPRDTERHVKRHDASPGVTHGVTPRDTNRIKEMTEDVDEQLVGLNAKLSNQQSPNQQLKPPVIKQHHNQQPELETGGGKDKPIPPSAAKGLTPSGLPTQAAPPPASGTIRGKGTDSKPGEQESSSGDNETEQLYQDLQVRYRQWHEDDQKNLPAEIKMLISPFLKRKEFTSADILHVISNSWIKSHQVKAPPDGCDLAFWCRKITSNIERAFQQTKNGQSYLREAMVNLGYTAGRHDPESAKRAWFKQLKAHGKEPEESKVEAARQLEAKTIELAETLKKYREFSHEDHACVEKYLKEAAEVGIKVTPVQKKFILDCCAVIGGGVGNRISERAVELVRGCGAQLNDPIRCRQALTLLKELYAEVDQQHLDDLANPGPYEPILRLGTDTLEDAISYLLSQGILKRDVK